MMTRDCETVFALLSEYLDQELPSSDCEELERHIAGCPDCVKFVDSLRKSVRLGRQYVVAGPVPPLPPALQHSLKDAYQRNLAQRQNTQRQNTQE